MCAGRVHLLAMPLLVGVLPAYLWPTSPLPVALEWNTLKTSNFAFIQADFKPPSVRVPIWPAFSWCADFRQQERQDTNRTEFTKLKSIAFWTCPEEIGLYKTV
ncbi:unnamed protein product [Protopolystoma xenopodis]|uniref:Secreted protein n=1 Tax=Protopolystoma xenopodis TaxID=117903 RepID=A0A448XL20_9PLAT|nr:unnamed protein product [Protopolystoma xenopodis]